MSAYYNEIDPYAAQWLRNLIEAGHIAPGIVDERSIEDVTPEELKQYTQCHFFAGIGVWSYALRQAGWPDEQPIWTGSCPCQPFSSAGKCAGVADERHLWPAWHHLISQCRPDVVFGEQVASKDALGWLDLVHADMEGSGYAFGAADTCAAGFDAPHIRQRLYWVAYTESPRGVSQRETGEHRSQWSNGIGGSGGFSVVADSEGRGWGEEQSDCGGGNARDGAREAVVRSGSCDIGGVANSTVFRCESEQDERSTGVFGEVLQPGRLGKQSCDMGSTLGGMADTAGERERTDELRPDCRNGQQLARAEPRGDGRHHGANVKECSNPSPTNGFWADADWLFCRDGKWRPVESGTFPLAHGVTNRVGRLRAYGNCIVAPQAIEVIKAFLQGPLI